MIEDHHPVAQISARKQVRIEAENFRQLEGFVVEDRRDKGVSHQLGIKLAGRTNGTIRTRFDQPFVKESGRYHILIRYLDEENVQARCALFVTGAARGDAWQSAGEGRGWTSHAIGDVEIRVGDEIRLDASGSAIRLDYVQLNARESEGQ